jgi:shikimate kinase
MWLIGMMGSGKSTIGAMAADELGLRFFDTDRMIVERAGMLIPEIWMARGEQAFRELERSAVSSVPVDGSLAAAGGGAVLNAVNRAVMASAPPVIWLRARPETLARRVEAAGQRPLLDTTLPLEERMREILRERNRIYHEIATHVLDTDGLGPDEVVDQVVAIWRS